MILKVRADPAFSALTILGSGRFSALASTSSDNHDHRSPGHHTVGGSLTDIFLTRSATRWLRLYG
jgi:hypothetical protein